MELRVEPSTEPEAIALFPIAAPILWNSLPKPVKDCTDTDTFKSLIKTQLFLMSNAALTCFYVLISVDFLSHLYL